MRRALIALAAAVAAFLITAGPAAACSCVHMGDACGASGEFWRASAVFHGRVESSERVQGKEGWRFLGRRRVTLRIVEGFRGTRAGSEEISVLTGSGGGDCGYPFRVGQEYLVYANRNEESGELTTGICSRTKKSDDAKADIEYARQATAGQAPAGRLTGEIELHVPDVTRFARGSVRPMSGVQVVFEKDGSTVSATSGDDGRYTLEGLASGTYKVSVETPKGYFAANVQQTVEVPDLRSCQQMNVRVQHDGRISGRVVDARGRGVASLKVEVLPAANADSHALDLQALTREDGTYEVGHVPPGRFVVGINTRRDTDGEVMADPRILHPGVESSRGATVVNLGPSEPMMIGDLVLPQTLNYVSVAGLVVGGDGVPVQGAKVYLKGDGAPGYILNGPVSTDASGRFVIAALSGRRYRIFAEQTGKAGKRSWSSSSEQFPIEATETLSPIKLVLRRQI